MKAIAETIAVLSPNRRALLELLLEERGLSLADVPASPEERKGDGTPFVAPRDAEELQLADIWENVLGVQPVGIRDNFFELGGDSLLAVRLFAEIAKILRRPLPLATLFEAPTVEGLAAVLRREGRPAASPVLVPIQPGNARPPLFCAHQHTGHLFCYQELARYLGPDQPVYGLAPRALDGVQAPHARIEDMAAAYIHAIRAAQPEGPYHLAGYCFGGVLAFEMARQLRAQGQAVALVALIEATWTGNGHPLRRAARRIGRRIAFEREHLGRMMVPERIGHLLAKTTSLVTDQAARVVEALAARRRVGRKRPSPVEDAIRRVEAAHREALRRYVPQVYPGELTLFRPARPAAAHHGDPTWGWEGLAAGGLDVHEIPGECPTMVDEPDVQVLADRLRQCLRRAQEAP